jgi:hypothetical protein
MKNQDYTRLEQIFNKSLQTIPSLELWKVYLQYVRKRNSEPDGTPKGIEGRKTINEAYELGLQNIGLDKDSGTVWLEYLDFLKSSQVCNILFFSLSYISGFSPFVFNYQVKSYKPNKLQSKRALFCFTVFASLGFNSIL